MKILITFTVHGEKTKQNTQKKTEVHNGNLYFVFKNIKFQKEESIYQLC